MPRPREISISRFNIATNFDTELKFDRLCFLLRMDKRMVGWYLVKFWNFVAKNRAMTGSISGVESWAIAKFIGWDIQNDGDADIFISALKKSGYVSDGRNYPEEPDGTVHDWFDHQPLAREILRARKNREEEPEHKTEPKTKVESTKRPTYEVQMKSFQMEWNVLAQKFGFQSVDLFKKSESADKRREHFRKHFHSGELKPEELFKEIPQSKFLQGKSGDRAFKLSFDFLFQTRKSTGIRQYTLIQEGDYRDKRKGEPDKQFEEWA